MKRLISFPIGMFIFITLGWLAIHSPKIPYNVHELFATRYPLLTPCIFSFLLYWCFGIPLWLALWLTTGKWIKVVLFPFLILVHGTVSYVFLRISVPMECIWDIVGSPILNWPWEWELLGRFVALFTVFSLFLTGGAFIALLQTYNYFYKWRLMWRWVVNLIILPIAYWVVVRQASTDNLTELMRGGGNWISILSLGSFIFIIGCTASTLLVQLLSQRYYSLISTLIIVFLSLPIGFLALIAATEDVIYKYGSSFSGLQFLFSPNRSELINLEALIFRYIVFHIIIVGIIIISQYPFWGLRYNETKRK